MNEPLPTFRYHPDPIATGAIVARQIVCKCCGKPRSHVYTLTPYGPGRDQDFEPLCPWCIADGTAASRWGVSFNEFRLGENVTDPLREAEILYRTPAYLTWQEDEWLAHCGDGCAFIGEVGGDELRAHGDEVIQQVWPDVQDSFEDPEDMLGSLMKGGSAIGYLFRCLHCGHHRLHWDCD
jgi:uncharacterized protein